MPAPESSQKCAYCAQHFNAPSTFELKADLTGFIWRTPEIEIAQARIEDGIWRLYVNGAQRPAISMLAIRRDGRYSVALLDEALDKIATVVVRLDPTQLPRSKRFIAVVNDDAQTVMVIHGDGPTGYHLVNKLGDVLALASPKEGFALTGLDVLLTGASYGGRPVEFFAILLAVILARLSEPSCSFADIDHLCLDAAAQDLQGSDPNEA